jgi:hypothetical protein
MERRATNERISMRGKFEKELSAIKFSQVSRLSGFRFSFLCGIQLTQYNKKESPATKKRNTLYQD